MSFEKLAGRDNSVYRINEGNNLDEKPKTWFECHSAEMRTLMEQPSSRCLPIDCKPKMSLEEKILSGWF